jgi:hypothetical protein
MDMLSDLIGLFMDKRILRRKEKDLEMKILVVLLYHLVLSLTPSPSQVKI